MEQTSIASFKKAFQDWAQVSFVIWMEWIREGKVAETVYLFFWKRRDKKWTATKSYLPSSTQVRDKKVAPSDDC